MDASKASTNKTSRSEKQHISNHHKVQRNKVVQEVNSKNNQTSNRIQKQQMLNIIQLIKMPKTPEVEKANSKIEKNATFND